MAGVTCPPIAPRLVDAAQPFRPFGDKASYRDLLLALLPPGEVWARQGDSVLGEVLGAIAAAMLAPADKRAADLLNEIDPRSVSELIPRWENWLGLPDACDPAGSGDYPARRANILTRETAGPINRKADLQAFIEDFGYGVTIEEPMPLGTGHGRSGCMRTGSQWHGLFVRVLCRPGNASPRIGTGRAGLMRVGDCIPRPIDCLLRRFLPAHVALAVVYT
ncbi:putative phage tail protein [Lacibacterium aquatile]|uniref:Phage tail protein n=1 Tax=Lacibacterium aquatile TaxID=1168082 RepID=A0ABW5DUJ8_9PROT